MNASYQDKVCSKCKTRLPVPPPLIMLVSAWLVAYPVVTASAMVLMPLMKGFSLPMHTLVMVTLMTPTVGILASILAKKLTELLALRNQQSRP